MASLFAIERIILTDMILLSNFETMARRKSEGNLSISYHQGTLSAWY